MHRLPLAGQRLSQRRVAAPAAPAAVADIITQPWSTAIVTGTGTALPTLSAIVTRPWSTAIVTN